MRGPLVIGFAARGSISDVLAWVEQARHAGVHSVWIHDSLYERAAVTYAPAGALAIMDGLFDLPLFLAALIGAICLQIGTNITNEIYDARNGIDSITSSD